MEIRNSFLYLVISVLLSLSAAKPFSLNEALAAESELEAGDARLSHNPKETSGQRFSLNKSLTLDPDTRKKIKPGKLAVSKQTNKFKSSYKIPTKTKKLREILRSIHLRKGFSKKREIFKNDKHDSKYLPLLKNVGLLLDNLLKSNSAESYEISKNKYKRHKYEPNEKSGIVCKCAMQPDTDTGESKAYKKTTIATKTFSTETPLNTTTTAYSSVGDVSSVRQNKDLPVLLSRNSISDRRDSNGHGERSSTSFYGSSKGDISRNIRNRKYHSRTREYESNAESDKEITHRHSRDRTGSNEYRRRQDRGNTNVSIERSSTIERNEYQSDEKFNEIFGGKSYQEFSGENKLEIRGDETKGEKFLSNNIRRQRRPISKGKIGDDKGTLQSKEFHEKSFNNVSFNDTNDKRISNRISAASTETEETSPRDETMISIKDMSNLKLALQKSPDIKTPSVTIFDGYSVARDKNGQSKMSESSIHIHA